MYDILIESAEMTLEIDKNVLTEGALGSIKDKIIKFKDYLVSLFNRFKDWISKKIKSISRVAKAEFGKASFKDVYEYNKEKYAKTNVTAYPIELLNEIKKLLDAKPQAKDKEVIEKWVDSVNDLADKIGGYKTGPITVEKMKVLGGNNFSSLQKNLDVYTKARTEMDNLQKSDDSGLLERLTNTILINFHLLIGLANKIITESIRFNNIIMRDKIAYINKHSLTRVEVEKIRF